MTAPQRCVRCNLGRAYPGAFVCSECILEGKWQAEADEARKVDPAHPRLVLVRQGWRGGWPAVR